MSPVVLGKILDVFVNTLSAEAKYSIEDLENLPLQIQMQLYDNWKTFSEFLFHLWNLDNILNILKKKLVVIANVFPQLMTLKKFLRPLCKKSRFGTPFDSQHVEAPQILAKFPWERFYHVFLSFSVKLIWKMSPLVLGEILAMFVNTLTADGKYAVPSCENLELPIQMQLPKK